MPRLRTTLFVLTLTATALAQGLQNTSIQTNQPKQPGSVTTLRAGTKLVIVDVTVTDQNHHPVHNLKASDFTLQENNARQTVKSFEEHTAPTTADLQKIEPMPPMPAGVFTNFTPAPALANGPVNVLLIDRLNTPMENQTRLRTQLMDYLGQAKPGTRIAIFGLTTQLVLLQGFTDDPVLLRTVLDRKSNAKASPLLDAAVAGGGAPKPMSDAITELGIPDPTGQIARVVAYTKLLESEISTAQLMDRAKRTLEAMNALGRYLAGIPGRKNLIWFSGSFPLELLPTASPYAKFDDRGITPAAAALSGVAKYSEFNNVTDAKSEYHETISLLSRAQVAVYPVDVRGVTVLPGTTVAGEGGGGEKYLPPVRGKGMPTGSEILSQDIDTAMEQTYAGNNTMRDLAYQTGGQAFLNTNDLAGAVAEALDNGASYYTLTYTPSNGDWKGDFRKIEVKLRQQGLNLSYRRGYYADDPNAPPSRLATEASGHASAASLPSSPNFGAMHLALMHAGPEPTQVVLTAHVQPASASTEDTLTLGNEGSRDLKGPYRRYALDLSADAHDILFTSLPNGIHHGSMEFVTFVYDTDGKLINALGNSTHADLDEASYANALQHGIPIHQEISVPAKGEYFLRIAVHDLQGDNVGAVELPISSIRNLPPAPVNPPPIHTPTIQASVSTPASSAKLPAATAAPDAMAAASLPVIPLPPTVAQQPVAPLADQSPLDQILARVHENFEAYLAAIPSIFADEHLVSSMSAHDEGEGHIGLNAATDSIFRLSRNDAENRPVHLDESREIRTLDKHPVPPGQLLTGPVVILGAFGYGSSFLSPDLKRCYDYRLLTNQRLHGASVLVVEYALKPSVPTGYLCPIAEQNAGRAFLDPASMQVVRIEQKRPRHELESGTYNSLIEAHSGSVGNGWLAASQMSGSLGAMAVAMAPDNPGAVTIPSGTLGVWSWSIDYAPVTLDGKSFWLPKTITSNTATSTGRLINWSFVANYSNYHLLNVHSTILAPAVK